MRKAFVSVHAYGDLVPREEYLQTLEDYQDDSFDIIHLTSRDRVKDCIGYELGKNSIEDTNGRGNLRSDDVERLVGYDKIVAGGSNANICFPNFVNDLKESDLDPEIDPDATYLSDEDDRAPISDIMKGENANQILRRLYLTAPTFYQRS